jgi:hypothetical protein
MGVRASVLTFAYGGVSTTATRVRYMADGVGRVTIVVSQRAVGRAFANGEMDRLATRIVDGPELERIVARALGSPGVERIVARIIESPVVQEAIARVVDDVVERLRDSEALWRLIDDVVQSPVVTDAIAHQGAGFADQVNDQIRERSRTVDEKLERAAWRLLRRRAQPGGPAPSAAT